MKKNKSTNIVAGLLMISFIGIFLVLSGRFLYIQVSGEVNNVSLEQWAKQKRTSSYSLHAERSEERRVGKECRSGRWQDHKKKKRQSTIDNRTKKRQNKREKK